jgi:tetratricopeptide (TPR) repeat protein
MSGQWYKREWEFHSYTAEFTIDDETEESEEAAQETQDMSVEIRRECHEIAWKFLQAHQDSAVIIAVFLPFYRSFWHDILVAGDMNQEHVDVLTLLLNVSPDADTDDELWSYAYTLSELGRTDEAERAYRSYLERHPDHAATLHNLALLVGSQLKSRECRRAKRKTSGCRERPILEMNSPRDAQRGEKLARATGKPGQAGHKRCWLSPWP